MTKQHDPQPAWADDETRPEGWYWVTRPGAATPYPLKWKHGETYNPFSRTFTKKCMWVIGGHAMQGDTTESLEITLIGPAHPPAPTDTGLAERIEAVLSLYWPKDPRRSKEAAEDIQDCTKAILSEIESSQSSKALPEDGLIVPRHVIKSAHDSLCRMGAYGESIPLGDILQANPQSEPEDGTSDQSPSGREASAWRPIAEAPRDGTLIAVIAYDNCCDYLSAWAFGITHWAGDDWRGEYGGTLDFEPNYWLPLPPLPAEQAAQDQNEGCATSESEQRE